MLWEEADKISLLTSLSDLIRYLYEHHGVKPWLLIDDYDKPIHTAFVYCYYNDMINFMHLLLGNVFKTNSYLHISVITGIPPIAIKCVFTGMNHVAAYSLLHSEHFGFTEDELIDILKRSNLANIIQ